MDNERDKSAEEAALRDAKILAMKDGGASWKDVQEAFGLTRQQARYGYQRGKRVVRRKARREE